ncbi:hypothetical protein ACSSVY_003130 [Roseovarius sp. MBR-51]|jgi:hypothetical protein
MTKPFFLFWNIVPTRTLPGVGSYTRSVSLLRDLQHQLTLKCRGDILVAQGG